MPRLIETGSLLLISVQTSLLLWKLVPKSKRANELTVSQKRSSGGLSKP